MKYIKIFFILLLIWPKFWYMKVAGKAEEEWKRGGERPPQYSDETKKLIKKQKMAKRWSMILSIIPFGPIEYQFLQQIPEIEELKEIRLRRRETLIKYLEEKFKADNNIEWENIILNSERDKEIKEFLFGENGVLTREPENINNKDEEEGTEEFNI